jgi:uncharacterized protein (DUF1501 family)
MNIMTRRKFMSGFGSLGVVGLSSAMFPAWMPKLVFKPRNQMGQSGSRDVLVAVFQRGGMDGLNAVVPYGEGANYYDRRPTIAIPEPNGSDDSAIDLNGFFGLHPGLRPLKPVWDAGSLAVIHGAGSVHPTRSHFDAMEFMERGTPGDRTTAAGWISRHLQSASWENESPFRAVGIGAMVQGSLRGGAPALALSSIADFHLGGRDDQLSSMRSILSSLYGVSAPVDMLGAHAAEVFDTMTLLESMSSYEYVPQNGAEYPNTDFGNGLKQIAQLIKADVGLEVACVDAGGWDTHETQGGAYGQFNNLISDFGAGLGAFYTDMQDLMPNITVVTMSEFGRRATENASGGTDHGRGNCMFVMGGGATSGVYGNWPTLNADALDDGDLAVANDYRDILSEIISKRLQNPALDHIFPSHQPSMLNFLASR